MVVGEGASGEFEVKIGLRQCSVLSPLLFIALLDLISRKTVVKDAMKKLLYADDLALVANGKHELHETMEEWNGLFIKHGLKLNLEKTEVMPIGYQREELDIEREGKKLTQRDSFVYLEGAVCGDGKTEREVRRRVQAGANAWRAVEGVMADRRISKRLKGKVMLRWEDCVKRDVKKTGEEGDWKNKTGGKGGWRRIADEAVKKVAGSTSPPIKGKRGREREY